MVRDLEIGQPSNSAECSETADGVTRESEGAFGRSARGLCRSARHPKHLRVRGGTADGERRCGRGQQ